MKSAAKKICLLCVDGKFMDRMIAADGSQPEVYTDIKYDVPAGKYLLSIKGYVRKEQQKYPAPNCGFFFSLTEVENFESFKNPRESDEFDFNIGSMK